MLSEAKDLIDKHSDLLRRLRAAVRIGKLEETRATFRRGGLAGRRGALSKVILEILREDPYLAAKDVWKRLTERAGGPTIRAVEDGRIYIVGGRKGGTSKRSVVNLWSKLKEDARAEARARLKASASSS